MKKKKAIFKLVPRHWTWDLIGQEVTKSPFVPLSKHAAVVTQYTDKTEYTDSTHQEPDSQFQ